MKKVFLPSLLAITAIAIAANLWTPSAEACGGFFCTNVPVDQNAERIIFTQNGDSTISAYVQIAYTGAAPDFSWILPLPEAIEAKDITIPEGAMDAFQELEAATAPVIFPPEIPDCVRTQSPTAAAAASVERSVQVFASGEVGPYSFDVIGSYDPEALVTWLRENGYQVTPEMEPIIDLYVEEKFVFLAMKLRPDQGIQDIEPVKITYPSERPMIPLRLTAVAANPDMRVLVWIFADQQATPSNYASINIRDDEFVFFDRTGRNNYQTMIRDKANEYGGQAFITEYAAPSNELKVVQPLLQELRSRHPYVTRLNTVISPHEMTLDPVFDYDAQLKDISNIRDLRGMTGLFQCERAAQNTAQTNGTNQTASRDQDPPSKTNAKNEAGPRDQDPTYKTFKKWKLAIGIVIGVAATLIAVGLVYTGVIIGRSNNTPSNTT